MLGRDEMGALPNLMVFLMESFLFSFFSNFPFQLIYNSLFHAINKIWI